MPPNPSQAHAGSRPEPEPEPAPDDLDYPVAEEAVPQHSETEVVGGHSVLGMEAGKAHPTLSGAAARDHGVNLKTYTVAVWTGTISEADQKQWWFLPKDKQAWEEKYEALKKPLLTQQEAMDPAEAAKAKGFDLMNSPMPLRERFAHTQEHTCGPVYVQLIGERAIKKNGTVKHETILSKPQLLSNTEDPETQFCPGSCDEFAVTCVALDEIIGVEFFIDDTAQAPNGEPPTTDWNDRRWKLERVAVTCVQHDDLQTGTCASRMRKKKGEHADQSGRTGNNVQWSFVPPAVRHTCLPARSFSPYNPDESSSVQEKQWVGKLPPIPDKLHIERPKHLRRSGRDHDVISNLCCAAPPR